jgi:UDP-N-acetylmuramate--alanine ligase
LAREFGSALAAADAVVVLPVYPAREAAADFPGIDGHLIAATTADAARGRAVAWMPGFVQARRLLAEWLREGDVCLMMGAGDIDVLARSLVK